MLPAAEAIMTPLLTMGETLSVNAVLYPDKIGARDLHRSMSFRLWNQRCCRLANALLGLGLVKGDRVAVLAYNCVEWIADAEMPRTATGKILHRLLKGRM